MGVPNLFKYCKFEAINIKEYPYKKSRNRYVCNIT